MRKSVSAIKCLRDKHLPCVDEFGTLGNGLALNVAHVALHFSDVVERHIAWTLLVVKSVEVRGPAKLLICKRRPECLLDWDRSYERYDVMVTNLT